MGRHSKKDWRDSGKIDPCFDELIKHYLDFIRLVDLDSNSGFVSFNDEALKILKNEKLMKKAKTNSSNLPLNDNTIKTLIKTGASKDTEDLNDFLKAFKPKERIGPKKFILKMRVLLKKIDNLPDEKCRKYYQEKFAPFQSWKIFRYFISKKNAEGIREWYEEFLYAYMALFFRVVSTGKDQNSAITLSNKEIAKLLKTTIFHINELIAIRNYKMSFQDLIDKAKSGNNDYLFKAIRIDKTVITEEWVKDKIKEATYTGKLSFFDKLSHAIKAPPAGEKVTYSETLMVLKFFWPMGLEKLTIPQLKGLLKEHNLKIQSSDNNLRDYINEHINNGFLQGKIMSR